MKMKRVPRRFEPGRFDLRIKKSRAGRGLFTYTDIAPGACIIEYKGRNVGKREMEESVAFAIVAIADVLKVN
jgi:hypothetical protein